MGGKTGEIGGQRELGVGTLSHRIFESKEARKVLFSDIIHSEFCLLTELSVDGQLFGLDGRPGDSRQKQGGHHARAHQKQCESDPLLETSGASMSWTLAFAPRGCKGDSFGFRARRCWDS